MPCTDGAVIDVSGKIVIPGLIDIHIHGAFGWDASVDTPDESVLIALAHRGTTALLPTIYPISSRENRLCVLRSYRELLKNGHEGANVLGVHMEGPFLNPELGAQLPEWCESPAVDGFDVYLDEFGDIIKIMSLSPELPGSDRLARRLLEKGIIAAAAHSAANTDEMERVRRAGLTHGTHIFNATKRPEHPSVGCISSDMNEFCLADEYMTADIMVDGQRLHMDDVLLKLAWICKSPDRLMVMSDSMNVAGFPPGVYETNDGRKLIVDESDVCRFENGDFCGSKMMILDALKNLMARLNLNLEQALPAATCNPARLLGIGSRKGAIAPEMDADLVILDESLNVHSVILDGKIV